jgi:hypothetical protein
MKKLLISLLALTMVCISSCLDTQDEVTINKDGSGVYVNTVDLSGILDMMQMAVITDTSAAKGLNEFADKNIDSTISLRSFTDTSTTLTEEQKTLLQNGTAHILLDQKEKQFRVTMKYPFKKMEDVAKIMELQQSGKGYMPLKSSKDSSGLTGMGDEGLPAMDKILSITFKNGLIERKVDEEKLNDLKTKEQTNQQAEMMFREINYSTIIHLPSPVKSSQGERLTISDDKKTIRMKFNLWDIMQNPQLMNFRIAY